MRTNLPVTDNEVKLADDTLVVSKTDLQGIITYVNRDFQETSGYSEAELIGEAHSIMRHPDMPAEVFADLWRTLKAGRPWVGLVKNRCKNGDYYWALTNTTPLWEGGQIAGYLSVRRKAEPADSAAAEAMYRKFRDKQQGGLKIRYGQVVSGGEGIFSRLNLAGRMGMVLGGLGLIVFAVMAYALLSLSRTNDSLEQIFNHDLEPIRIIGRINTLMADSRAQLLLGLQHDPINPFSKEHDHPITLHTDVVHRNIAETTALWEEYQKSILGDEHRALAEAYAAARKVYLLNGQVPMLQAQVDGNYSEAQLLLLMKVNPGYNAAAGKAEGLFGYHKDRALLDMANAEERYHNAFIGMIAALLALLVIGLLAAVRLIGSVRRPIQAAIDTFHGIAGGNYNNAIDITRNDELGRLNQALQAMQTRLGFDMAETRRVADAMTRIKIALDNVSTGVMIVNPERTIIYANKSVQAILKNAETDIRTQLPHFDVDQLIGANIDGFHKNPSHQTGLLADLAGKHLTDLVIGTRHLSVTFNPVFNAANERLGTVAEWQDRTAEVAVELEVESIVSGAAEGDFTRRLALEGKTGFFRDLSTGLNQLLDTAAAGLSAVAAVLGALSRGDLTQTMTGNFKGTFGQLKDDTNTTVERLRDVISRIQEATEAINIAAQQIAAGNQDLSSRTEEQASSLEETASSMEELSGTVRQNAESARQANELASVSNAIAVRGGQIVRQVVTTMTGIQTSAQKISDIIGVIDSIAFQTNILAL
ncbi:MAG: MCP four helix bundle domain-containing protein, partial [Gammaproteobacteria bacterium]|nr:MCP four helix bundle domain-containing protein [Gammaproteobacteria bacterium]